MDQEHYDIAIVGGGIIGLAHAYIAAKELGLRVLLLEREDRAIGASIRNFGMIWPIGQSSEALPMAMQSRQYWLEASSLANFWAPSVGSLHLAYREDELAVLTDFVDGAKARGYEVQLQSPAAICAANPAIVAEGLLGGMYSATEVNVDPRQAISQLHLYLSEALGVDIRYRHLVKEISYPQVHTSQGSFSADRVIVATGADFETLYPELFAAAPIQKCKLQMMRTPIQPAAYSLGANLAAGLTLQHYASFKTCESLARLEARIAMEMPQYNQYGIHVMASQTVLGEITIGDSHEYGHTFDPFITQEINQLVLDYLATFLRLPDPSIQSYWYGIYPKLQNGKSVLILHPEPGVTVVNGVGGAGMTMSFGLAEAILSGRSEPAIFEDLKREA